MLGIYKILDVTSNSNSIAIVFSGIFLKTVFKKNKKLFLSILCQRFDQSLHPYQDYKHKKRKYIMLVIGIVHRSSVITKYKL